MGFQELLSYACELEHAGLQSQPQAYAIKINSIEMDRGEAIGAEYESQIYHQNEEIGGGFHRGGTDDIYTEEVINGLREEGARKGLPYQCCYQCFRQGHNCKDCTKYSCLFCSKSVKDHISLRCGRCPENLTSFLKELSRVLKNDREVSNKTNIGNPSKMMVGPYRNFGRGRAFRGRYQGRGSRGNRPFKPKTNAMMQIEYSDQGDEDQLTEEELSNLVDW